MKLFLGYTYVDAIQKDSGSSAQLPLNSPHQGSAILMFEEHGSYRLGFESYYYSSQKLNDSETGRGYTIFGIMGEKTWGRYTVLAYFEYMYVLRTFRYVPFITSSSQLTSYA